MNADEKPNVPEAEPCPSCGGSVFISPDRTLWLCEDCAWQAEDLGD